MPIAPVPSVHLKPNLNRKTSAKQFWILDFGFWIAFTNSANFPLGFSLLLALSSSAFEGMN
ncbi:hypothetical protein [Calothrix sp. FACHB-1219]|uniref:hypothetical protein n=1 Tax=Calothrix sp. FACHB-1219 TaxID=2692778 RepID=UPI0016845F00|nr:hypothetical protein [Calothrix sp. FACHB-1219]